LIRTEAVTNPTGGRTAASCKRICCGVLGEKPEAGFLPTVLVIARLPETTKKYIVADDILKAIQERRRAGGSSRSVGQYRTPIFASRQDILGHVHQDDKRYELKNAYSHRE
jgi:hypothetical protein